MFEVEKHFAWLNRDVCLYSQLSSRQIKGMPVRDVSVATINLAQLNSVCGKGLSQIPLKL